MMVTLFLWTNNINVPCKPPTHVFEGKVRQKKWGQYTSKYGKQSKNVFPKHFLPYINKCKKLWPTGQMFPYNKTDWPIKEFCI
jgi:hypothetical protein